MVCRKCPTRFSVMALFLILGTKVFAIDVSEYQHHNLTQPGRDLMVFYVAGLSDAYRWANADLVHKEEKPLYCFPPKLKVSVDFYQSIILDKIKEASTHASAEELGTTDVATVLLVGLQEAFPCPSK